MIADARSEKEEIFQRNLFFFTPSQSRQLVGLRKKINKTKSTQEHLSVISARNNQFPVLKWRGKNLHSGFDPLKEAHRRVQGVTLNEYTAVVYLGADLLYVLDCLDAETSEANSENKKKPVLVLVFLDWKFLITVLETRILFGLRKFRKVEYVCLNEEKKISEALIDSLTISTWVVSNEVLYKEADDFKRIHYKIEEHTRMLASAFFTQYYFEKRWMRNLISNWSFSPQSFSFACLRGRFHGHKAILVGAGVSLSEHLTYLKFLSKKLGGDYFICAVDTALPVLLTNGIPLDIVISLDGGYYNSWDFSRRPDKETLLITYPHLYPSVIRDFPGLVYYFYFKKDNEEGLTDPLIRFWRESFQDKQEWEGLRLRTGNVSVAAVELLSEMGFSEIILSGVDFVSPFFINHPSGGMHHDYYLRNHTRLRNLETWEFEETYHRMSKEDKIHFLKLKKDDWRVSTMLLDHSARELIDRIQLINKDRKICWKQFSSQFSRRLLEEIQPQDIPVKVKFPHKQEKVSFPFLFQEVNEPVMRLECLQLFLQNFKKAIVIAEGCLKDYQEQPDLRVLEKRLSGLGFNFLEITHMIKKLYSGTNKVVPSNVFMSREMGNILAIMRSKVTALLN